jgi:hypothetical protein
MAYYIRKIRINRFNEVYSLHKFPGFMAAVRIIIIIIMNFYLIYPA